MKREIHVPISDPGASKSSSDALDRIPDIDNRYLDVNTILSWLDKLVETHKQDVGRYADEILYRRTNKQNS